MDTKTKSNKIDFCKNPYKGVFTEVAKSEGKTRQAVKQAYWNNNTEVVKKVNKVIEKRKAIIGNKKKINSNLIGA